MPKKEVKKKKRRVNVKSHMSKFREIMFTGLATALGLIIALVWKDVLTEYFSNLASLSPVHGKFITALIVTVIAAIALLILSAFSQEDKVSKK